MVAGTQLAGATQIVVAIGDLTTPNANTVAVQSGGGLAVTNISGTPLVATATITSGVNLTQIATAPIAIQGNASDAVTTTSSALLPTATYLYGYNGTTWDRARNNGNTNITNQIGVSNGPGLITTSLLFVYDRIGNGQVNALQGVAGDGGVLSVGTEGTRTTYSAAVAQAAFSAASGTDVFLINGSATAVVRVSRIEVSFTSLQPVNIPMSLVRRSAVTTAGTSALPAMIIHDTSNAAASAVVVNYTNTAGQVPGTPRGPVRSAVVSATLASVGSDTPWVLDFSTRNTKAMILRGTSEVLALTISSGGATTGASNISVDIEWSEALA